MTKKSNSPQKSTKKASKPAPIYTSKKVILVIFVLAALLVGVATLVNVSLAQAKKDNSNNVPLTSVAESSASNISVATQGNTINVQFDYDLVNGAQSAIVSAALSAQRAFDPVIVTGPGRYSETLTNVKDGTYYITIVLSGNPQYALGDPDKPKKVLFVTIPDSQKTKNGDPFVRDIRKFFRQQGNNF